MKKRVLSSCCNATVHHFPMDGLTSMNQSVFFCSKCNKVCQALIEKEKKEEKTS